MMTIRVKRRSRFALISAILPIKICAFYIQITKRLQYCMLQERQVNDIIGSLIYLSLIAKDLDCRKYYDEIWYSPSDNQEIDDI